MVSMSLAMPTLANRVITRGYMEILFFQRGLNLMCIFYTDYVKWTDVFVFSSLMPASDGAVLLDW